MLLRIEQISGGAPQIQQGALYALHRLESIFGRVTRQLAIACSLVSGALFTASGFGAGRAAALLLTVAPLIAIVE